MSQSERERFERECRRRAEEICLGIERSVPNERRETRRVTIEGVYPDTSIVVEGWDRVQQQEFRDEFPLWRERSWATKEGVYAKLQQVGNLIATWVHER